MKLPVHEATTAQLGAVYPFFSSSPLPVESVFVGRDLYGGIFFHDPFALYAAGVLTNPNMVVLGQIGRGKSSFVKTYLYRHAAFGRRVVVLDPKGEYDQFARALNCEPIRLVPGGDVRLNPLDVGSRRNGDDNVAGQRQLEVLLGVAASCLGRVLCPPEVAALELALSDVVGTCGVPTLPFVVDRLLFPSADSARCIGTDVATLKADGRNVALELRRLVCGDLGGMFDGPTSSKARMDGDVVVLDLSAMYRSPALGTLIVCTSAALESSWRQNANQTIVVIDEAWAVLANLGAAQFFQSTWKLARALGVANIAVLHRVSDLFAVGADGSVGMKLARGLLNDCETVVAYAQSAAELVGSASLLGIDEGEVRILANLRRAVALWRVGDRSFLVEHRLAPLERPMIDTDQHLLGARKLG